MNSPRFNPTIAFVTVAVFVSAIILVLVMRGGSDEPAPPEPPGTQQPAEPAPPESPGTQQGVEPAPPEPPDEPAPPEEPEVPDEPEELAPEPRPGGSLPDDWDRLTSAQKTERNPLDCDHETQWVSAEDGSCIGKSSQAPTGTDAFPFRLGSHASDIRCVYFLLGSFTHGAGWNRHDSAGQDLECEMHIHLEPTVDLDPDGDGPLWPYVAKSKNGRVRDSRPSDHCLNIDPGIFSVRITDDAEEGSTFSMLTAKRVFAFCRPLAAGDDFEAVVEFEIPDLFFDEELLRATTPGDDLRPITTGSATVRMHHVSPSVELPVSYAIHGSYLTE